jgi:hypothetical protein
MATNFEVIRSWYETRARGETPDDIYADDIEWDEGGPGHPYGGTFRGLEVIEQEVFAKIGRDWEQLRMVPSQFIDGGDTIIVLGKDHGMVRGGDQEFVCDTVHAYWMRDGKVVRFRQYTDTASWHAALNRAHRG